MHLSSGDIQALLSLLPPFPGLRVLEVGCGCGILSFPLAAHLKHHEGRLDLYEFPDADGAHGALDQSVAPSNMRLHLLSHRTVPHITEREYEVAFLTNAYHTFPDPKTLLSEIYHGLENSGIFGLITSQNDTDIQNATADMDREGFVAINPIELDEGSVVITAKKMHHWGRGM